MQYSALTALTGLLYYNAESEFSKSLAGVGFSLAYIMQYLDGFTTDTFWSLMTLDSKSDGLKTMRNLETKKPRLLLYVQNFHYVEQEEIKEEFDEEKQKQEAVKIKAKIQKKLGKVESNTDLTSQFKKVNHEISKRTPPKDSFHENDIVITKHDIRESDITKIEDISDSTDFFEQHKDIKIFKLNMKYHCTPSELARLQLLKN